MSSLDSYSREPLSEGLSIQVAMEGTGLKLVPFIEGVRCRHVQATVHCEGEDYYVAITEADSDRVYTQRHYQSVDPEPVIREAFKLLKLQLFGEEGDLWS